MPKPITLEQLEAMSPDQRKTLHANAMALDTPAARAVIELLSTGDLMRRPVVAKTTTAKPRAAKAAGAKAAPAKPRAAKARTATYGRQS